MSTEEGKASSSEVVSSEADSPAGDGLSSRRRRVVVCHGRQRHGLLLEPQETWGSLAQKVQRKCQVQLNRLFVRQTTATTSGPDHKHKHHHVQIDQAEFIRDNDVLLVNESVEEEDDDDVDGKDPPPLSSSDWLRLNVGGTTFATTRSTLQAASPQSMLALMLASEKGGRMSAGARDEDGAILIDRSPEYFQPILNFLRTGKVILNQGVNPEGVYEEAKYYGIVEMLPLLESQVNEFNQPVDQRPLTRRNVVDALIVTKGHEELRFQGVNLKNADLSNLELRHINFKYANLSHCNLSGATLNYCNMERADLSSAVLDGAQMLGVKMLCANLEGASLKGCNFDDPSGTYAILEGVNLRGAVMEASNMARVNLRVATVKHGNMKNCDLRFASLAGADLEFCDLSGSDLHEANLRGANLKDTTLELMQTPLHMAQTIR